MARFIRLVSNALANAFANAPNNRLPENLDDEDLDDADQQPQQSQQPARAPANENPLPFLQFQTPEQLMAAANNDPNILLQQFTAINEANAQWEKQRNNFAAWEQRLVNSQTHVETVQREAEQARLEANQARREAEDSARFNPLPKQPSRVPNYTFNDDFRPDLQPVRKSPKFPDPDQYDGDRAALKGFLYKLRSKLSSNADWYPIEVDLVRYSVSRLKGTAEQRTRLVTLLLFAKPFAGAPN